MPAGRERVLSDEALDRLARELFAEVRAQHPRKALGKLGGDATGDVGIDLLGWLLDAGDDAGDGDSSNEQRPLYRDRVREGSRALGGYAQLDRNRVRPVGIGGVQPYRHPQGLSCY